MPKLKVLSGRQIRAILEAHGFVFKRQKVSHMSMHRATEAGTIVVPDHDHDEVKVGTLSSIIRLSGLPRELFEA
jgi:predicted RNA binding protein YcfA (HicA-like mRNA interferase family)